MGTRPCGRAVCVRDMLLGRLHEDIDVATSATPETIISLFTRTRKVGVQFGVVLVSQGPWWIETATFRTDLEYTDGRRPTGVVFTTAEEDAKRRDFTINGLFYDPIDKRVIDYVAGQRDLEARVVRAIGDPAARFGEDHLRMLRAVRFATRLGFTIDPATAAAVTRHAAQIARISPERIREELEKMLEAPSRADSIARIAGLGLLQYLWPGAEQCSPDRLRRAVGVLSHLPEQADFVLAMAALLHEDSPADVERIMRALRCSNSQIEDAVWLVATHDRIEETAKLSTAAFKKLLINPRFGDLLALHEALCRALSRPIESLDLARHRREAIAPEEIAPPPLVTGEDLISAGLQPGPRFKQILEIVYDAQLNQEFTDRERALQRMRELIATT